MKKLARQTRALERFTFLTFDEWFKRTYPGSEFIGDGNLGDIIVEGQYHLYVSRKNVERAALLTAIA